MKNLFKKTLACCLALCMVFTLCICAVTVSAEEFDGALTIAVNPENVTTETKELVVTYTAEAYNYQLNGIAAAQVDVSVPAGLTIKSVGIDAENFEESASIQFAIEGGSVALDTLYPTTDKVPVVTDNVFTYIVWCYASDATVLTAPATFIVTYEGEFSEGAKLTFGTEVVACKDAKDFINLEEKSVEITVESAACKHANVTVLKAVAATCTKTGLTEGSKCADCDKVLVEQKVVEKIAHTPAEAVVENNVDATCYAEGSYDSVVYCSVADCKAEISRTPVVVEKIAHTPAEAVEENRVEAKPGVAGSYDSVVYCAVEACKAEISRTPMEIPALPEEIVPEEDASIVVRDTGVLINATLDMRVRVRSSVIPADCATAEVIVTPTIYDSAYNPTPGTPFVETFDMTTTTGNLTVIPTNFSLFALDLPMYVQVKCYDANDNLYKYSPVYTYYPADALKAQYKATPAKDSDIKLNTLVTDMLNMSAAAQIFFADNANASSALKATVTAGNLVNKDWPQDYASKTEPTYNTVNNLGEANTNQLRLGADLSGAPVISYSVRNASTNLTDKSKLKMTVSYTSYYGKAAGGEVVSDTIEGAEWDKYYTGKHINYNFVDCAMYDGNKTVTLVLTYDGEEVVRSEYSLETYIAENSVGETNLAKCLKAMGIFGASARAYFALQGTVDA